jgi:hypothetical protein
VRGKALANNQGKDGNNDKSTSDFLDHFLKPLHLWGFSVGHLDSISSSTFSISVLCKNWREDHLSKLSLFEGKNSNNDGENSHGSELALVHFNGSIVSIFVIPSNGLEGSSVEEEADVREHFDGSRDHQKIGDDD